MKDHDEGMLVGIHYPGNGESEIAILGPRTQEGNVVTNHVGESYSARYDIITESGVQINFGQLKRLSEPDIKPVIAQLLKR